MRILLLAVCLAACATEAGPAPVERHWHDVPRFALHPIAEDVDAATWGQAVADAADRWRVELAAVGCEVRIELADDGHEVRGWTEAAWPFPSFWLGSTTFGANESMDVVGDLASDKREQVLMHEMGHALGLPHVEDRPSLMNPRAGELTDEDVENAALALGCR